jgi:hypothetical protein
MIRSHESSFILFPTSGTVYVWRTPKETYNPENLVPTVKHGGRFCDGLGSNIMIQYYVGPIVTLHGRFLLNDAVFQGDNAPIHTAGSVQPWFEKHEG